LGWRSSSLVGHYDVMARHPSTVLDALVGGVSQATIELRRTAVPPRVISREQLLARAGVIASQLAAWGVERGDRVMTFLPTGEELLATIVAAWALGAVSVCASPSRPSRRLEVHRERLRRVLATALPKVVIGGEPVFDIVRDDVSRAHPVQWCAESDLPPIGRGDPWPAVARPSPDDIAHIQFTSGTTGPSRAVVLRHGQLVENVLASAGRSRLDHRDRLMSWLPLFHDMGFVAGFCAPLLLGMELCLQTTESFIARPASWLETITEHGATVSAAPTFAYDLLARRVSDARLGRIDLASWRYAWVGAEPVFHRVVRDFERRFARHGLVEHTLRPAYGLAEATLAVCMPEPREALGVEWIDREVFQRERRAVPGTVPIVGAGRPIDGVELRIVSAEGEELPERHEGRILVSGPCVAEDGELDTGDLGFLAHGELFVTGRSKDVLVRGGHNVHAHEVEQAALLVDGVHPGRAAAFAVTNHDAQRDEIVVVVEPSPRTYVTDLSDRVARMVAEAAGVQVDRVVVVPRGTIPSTTSGKIQRSLLRELLGGAT
jgi:acyl-CoA synthetase (AMP-forming)/AMP-acid ligase II